MIRFLSWNIRQGGGSRTARIIDFLKKQDANIIVLSEFQNNPNGLMIRQKLMNAGFLYQFVTKTEGSTNSVLIASKFVANSKLYFDSGYDYSQGIIRANFEAFSLFGLYLPHKKKHKLFDLISDEIEKGEPAILLGDFNTGINFIDQKGDSFWYADRLKELKEKGYKDAFRHVNGDVESYSWYSHQGNGYRYDHTFVHQNLVPLKTACDYLHEARENKLSDHSPMVLELGT